MRAPEQFSTPSHTKASIILDHVFYNYASYEQMEAACVVIDLLPEEVQLPCVWWSEPNSCFELVWQVDRKILRVWVLDGQIALYAEFGGEERSIIEDCDGKSLPPYLTELLSQAFKCLQ